MPIDHYWAVPRLHPNYTVFTENAKKLPKRGVPLFFTRFWEPSTYLGTPQATFLAPEAVSNGPKIALGGSASRWGVLSRC